MDFKALWQHLVTKEKALFKSATVYVAALIAAMPDIAGFAQQNFEQVAKYIPAAWHDRSLSLIGLVVFLARARSLVKLPKAAAPLLAAIALCFTFPTHAQAAGTTATLNWTNPPSYNDCAVPPTGCTAVLASDITGYVISWSRTSGGPVIGTLALNAGLATTAQVPVGCGSVFFTVQVKVGANSPFPNSESDPTNPVAYASGVTCKPTPVTGVTAT